MVSLALDGAHLPTEGEGWWAGYNPKPETQKKPEALSLKLP